MKPTFPGTYSGTQRLLALTLLSTLMFIFSLPAKTITVEGTGYNRDGVVRNALRGAVEKCVGMSIDAQTIINGGA